MVKRLLVLLFMAIAVIVMARSPRAIEARKEYAINRECCDLSIAQALSTTFAESVSGAPSDHVTREPSRVFL